jgi:P pilus assembly chaperone PapD
MKTITSMTVLLVFLSAIAPAYGNLLVTPKRIVFDQRERTQQVILVNSTTDTRSYRLEWVEQRQVSGGSYQVLKAEEAEGRKKASDLMRFSPRQVTLGPGERQVVKIVARRSANMEPGEYRSHLLFSALPPAIEESDEEVDGISMKLNVLVSYSIPVLLNVGYQSPQVSVSNVKVQERPDQDNKFADIFVALDKRGEYSTYGTIKAFYRSSDSESFEQVGLLNGVSIFGEADSYNAMLSWMGLPESRKGELKIRYEGAAEFNGKTFTEELFPLDL